MPVLRPLGLAVLVLALAAPAAAATKDCRSSTPLPDDVRLVAPPADVPPNAAQFAGAWSGVWLDKAGDEVMCQTLLVEEVFPNGYARVVYSRGAYLGWGTRHPNFWRATGRVADGALRIVLPNPERTELLYRLDGAGLAAVVGEVRGKLARLGDVAPIDCVRSERAAPVTPPAGVRDRLTADELTAAAFSGRGPVHNDYFMPLGAWGPARHTLRGALTVAAASMSGSSRGCPSLPTPVPAFTVAFFTAGEHLVPVIRDIVPAGRLIVSPGRVWSEPGDGGMSRASFPFVLVNQVHNGAHNGLATFLFDDTRVSALRLQIVQETSAWSKFDFWGHLPMTYTPGPIASEPALRAEFAEELRARTPMRPWSTLPASPALATFDGDAEPGDISANGLVLDGTLYVRGCNTRHGPFPYCREMRHGVFSVTKSLGAAVALLRLAQKYGDAVLDEKVVDYLPPGSRPHAGWNDVTFADALNMATGIGDEGRERDGSTSADENRPKMFGWIVKRSLREKLEIALSYGKYAWNRGEVLRYNSTQTFVLAVALDAYLKRREGPHAHLWDMVRAEVFRPIGILHAPKMHTIESDGSRGVPQLGYGLYPTVDDVAKLTALLQNGGRHDGAQLLSATKLAEALYRTSATAGLPSGSRNRFGAGRYHLSFWSAPYRTSTGCFFQIPLMLGYGGNLVALLPNGVSVFRFADGMNFDVDTMILAGESLRPFCAAPPTTEQTTPRAALTAAELAAEIGGHVLAVGRQRLFFAPGGHLFGSFPEAIDVGTWEIRPEGRVCRRWNVGDRGLLRCYVVYRQDDTYELELLDRFTRFVARRAPEGFER
ncbi:MAG TPA: serine hydrolase domain-containing protein [Methylomirabilota bacterium]|nr:serine hydrolase domain-containing protein [Methylomirabilota bacterium]